MKMLAYNFLAIYRRELQSYFASPLAYAIATIYWILAGILFKAAFDGVIEQGTLSICKLNREFRFLRSMCPTNCFAHIWV